MSTSTANTSGIEPAAPKPAAPKPAAPERPKFAPPPGRGPGGHGPFGGGMGMPAEKSLNFGPSAKRLLRRMNPERIGLVFVILLGVLSVVFAVLGPKLLGNATNIIFDGMISKQLPAGITQQQAIDGARAQGNETFANLLSGMTLVPGQGIDFTALGTVLLWVLALYVLASVFGYLQGYLLNGIVQRTILKLRAEVEDKLNRLPLAYLDRNQRGEVLSRVTNDIDNISQTLQQTLSQTLTSLLTVVGVLAMMLIISPLLAVVALIAIPLSLVVTTVIAKRSQPKFVAQWRSTGELNARVEETFTGHSLVKVFGRQSDAEQAFADKNAELYQSSFGAQFISGIIMPSMMFIGNLTYVAIAVVGGLRVASGTMSLGDVQAFIQYSRQFTQPLTQLASMANVLQSGVASAERVFEFLDADEQSPDPGGSEAGRDTARSGGVHRRRIPLRPGNPADRRPLAGRGTWSDGRHRRPDRRGEDDPGEPDHAVLRDRRRAHHPRRCRRGRDDAGGPAVPDRDGAAGHLAVRRHHQGQHRLRPAGRHRGRDPGRRKGYVRRPFRAFAPRRVRHADRRRGQQHQCR